MGQSIWPLGKWSPHTHPRGSARAPYRLLSAPRFTRNGPSIEQGERGGGLRTRLMVANVQSERCLSVCVRFFFSFSSTTTTATTTTIRQQRGRTHDRMRSTNVSSSNTRSNAKLVPFPECAPARSQIDHERERESGAGEKKTSGRRAAGCLRAIG